LDFIPKLRRSRDYTDKIRRLWLFIEPCRGIERL
jgi:hypothetical protein